MLHVRNEGYSDGKAITLMSTDTDNVSGSAELFHDLWGYMLEVIIGMSMLSMEVSWLGGLTLVLIFCTTSAMQDFYKLMKNSLFPSE